MLTDQPQRGLGVLAHAIHADQPKAVVDQYLQVFKHLRIRRVDCAGALIRMLASAIARIGNGHDLPRDQGIFGLRQTARGLLLGCRNRAVTAAQRE